MKAPTIKPGDQWERAEDGRRVIVSKVEGDIVETLDWQATRVIMSLEDFLAGHIQVIETTLN